METFLQARCERFLNDISALGRLRTRNSSDIDNKSVIDLTTNDYLGLAKSERVKNATIAALEKYGSSASGSPVVNGDLAIHKEFEENLCDWLGFNEAGLWSSGFLANESIMSGLASKGDIVLIDRLAHYSLIKGTLRSGARMIRYHHLGYDALEDQLKQYSKSSRNIFVVTESLFSMDGDYPDLERIAELKKKYNFVWIVDEAHGIGWYGAEGRGVCGMQGVIGSVDLLVGTLGKAMASQGAFAMFRNSVVKDYVINACKDFMYTTYLAPVLVGAANESLACIREIRESERKNWQQRACALRKALNIPVEGHNGSDGPILPIIIGSEEAVMCTAKQFYENGLKVAPIRPPSVPNGRSLLRLSLKTDLDMEVIAQRVQKSMKGISCA